MLASVRRLLSILIILSSTFFMTIIHARVISFTFHIQGIDSVMRKNIVAVLKNELPHESQTKIQVLQIKRLVKKALAPYGYFYPNISVSVEESFWHLIIKLNIDLGPNLQVNEYHVKIIGDEKKNKQAFTIIRKKSFHLRKNFIPLQYKEAKKALLVQLHDLGYLKANFSGSQVIVDLNRELVVIHLVVHLGRQYFFTDTHFLHTKLSRHFLQRYLKYRKGQPFVQDKLDVLHTDLMRSGYFDHVRIESNTLSKKMRPLPIRVLLNDRNVMRYFVGIGFDDDLGLRFHVGDYIRRINRWGHRLNFNYLLSGRLTKFSSSYIIPGKYPQTDNYHITGQYTIENNIVLGDDNQLTDQENYLLSLDQERKLGHWVRVFALKYLIEHVKFVGVPQKVVQLLYPEFIYHGSLTHLPSPIINFSFFGNASGNYGFFLSKTNFWKTEIHSSLYARLTDRTRLFMRGTLGAIRVNNWDDFPLSLKFFAGGAMSIRGYNYESIGPGKYLKLFSVEWQYRLYHSAYFTFFRDMGIASNRFSDNLLSAYGVGVMFASPVGQIQLSLAQPQGTSLKRLQLSFKI